MSHTLLYAVLSKAVTCVHIINTTDSTQHRVHHEHRVLTEQISYIVCAWPMF